MAVDSGAHIVYFSNTQASKIVNPVTHTVSLIDIPPEGAASMVIDPGNQAVTTVPVGKMPSHLAVDADVYTAYVANRLDNTVTAIDTKNRCPDSDAGGGAHAAAVDAVTHAVLTANTRAGTTSIIERRRR
jgi:DNA-binding beta-propeller fold protein YncE